VVYDFMFGNGIIFDFLRRMARMSTLTIRAIPCAITTRISPATRTTIDGDVVAGYNCRTRLLGTRADQCRAPVDSRTAPAHPLHASMPAGHECSFVTTLLDAVMRSRNQSGFSWTNYDDDGDGVMDRLWVDPCGLREEDSTISLTDELRRIVRGRTPLPLSRVPSVPDLPGPISACPRMGIGVVSHTRSA